MIPLASSKKPKDENQTSCTAGSLAAKNSSSNKEREVQEVQFPKSNQTGETTHTRITVKYNCGFPNNLFIRGEGISGLSWDKGTAMKNVKADEWIWETDKPFTKAQFKIVLNDRQYESGENHPANCGKSMTYTPKF